MKKNHTLASKMPSWIPRPLILRKVKHELAVLRRWLALGPTARQMLREKHSFMGVFHLRNLEREIRSVLDRKVRGDIVEFGLGPGGSAVVLSQFATPQQPYHGFDVFSMIPPPTSSKDDEMSRQRYATIVAGKAEDHGDNRYYGYRSDLIGDIRSLLRRFGKPEDGISVHLHKGLFEDTLPLYNSSRVAFAHVDCDWYDPVKLCLEKVAPLLQVGGVIVVDDYPEWGGCKAATEEFLAVNEGAFRATMKERLVIERLQA